MPSPHINNNSRIARNTLFLYVRMIFVLFVSLYTTRVVLNALGVIDYGINNVVGGFVSMFAFLNTSMSNGIQRFYNFTIGSEGENSITKVYNTALLIQLIIAIVVFVLLETLGLWYLNTKMVIPSERLDVARWLYHFSAFSLILVIMQIPYSAAIMAHEKMDYYALVSIIDVTLKFVFALILPYISSDKLFVFGLYSFGIAILNFFLYFVYSKSHFKAIKLQCVYYKSLFRDMLSFSGWNIFGTFAYMLKGQGLNILLNAFFGPIVNAARGVSAMVSHAIQGFQSNIVISFRPQIVQSYAESNISRVKTLMYSLSKISYLMLFMLSMPVIVELPYILHIWLGDTIPDYTVPFTILILVNMIISSLTTPISQVVHATGKMKHFQIGTSLVVCSILPISWLFLKLGANPNAVYIVSLCMTCINQVVCLFLLKRVFPYSIVEYVKVVLVPCIVVSVVATLLTWAVHGVFSCSFIRLLLVAIVGVSFSAVISYFIAFNKYEREIVKGFINKVLKRNGHK